MLLKNFPVLYKKQPAVIQDIENGKYIIKYKVQPVPSEKKSKQPDLQIQKVREKDIAPLSLKPVISLEKMICAKDENLDKQIKEIYELLYADEDSSLQIISLEELAELIWNTFEAEKTWLLFKTLCDSREFELDENKLKNAEVAFRLRTQKEIAELGQKENQKIYESKIRSELINRIKSKKLNLPDDSRFMVEIENLALGITEKSKLMSEAEIAQTPEAAHKLLLDTGMWDITRNPYPSRCGLSMLSSKTVLGIPPEEDRFEIKETAYAIDNEWSTDPDDAISFDGKYLWIHIADPAAFVKPGSTADKAARARGATLYLPEGAVRMLPEESLEDYALGLKEKSPALSFRILLTEECTVEECIVFKTIVRVKRLTYKKAAELKDTPEFLPFFDIAKRNYNRRKKSGAIQINMPEVHINIDTAAQKVNIVPLCRNEADAMICEMMLLAGEGAAHFAFKNAIPFPYISQDKDEIKEEITEGFAGQFRLLKCMHKRNTGITPAMHSGLGIAIYSQVTSPLRRYTDLIAHEQLRAYLDGKKLIDKDKMLEYISEGDAGANAARKASRESEMHWKLVYLLQNPKWTGEAVCIEKRGNLCTMIIPSLAMQTQIKNGSALELNQTIKVKAENINIPMQTIEFIKI